MVDYLQRQLVGFSLFSALQAIFSTAFVVLLASAYLRAQCPDTGETKVIKPSHGDGYYFYKFIGDDSYVYFLDGKTFSYNDKDDPGKTFILIDDFAYEPLLLNKSDLAEYVHSSKDMDILLAQAKHEEGYFQKTASSVKITDFGPSARKNLDGSDGRLFYLWKKENAAGQKERAQQYLVSTVVHGRVAVMSFMLMKDSTSEAEVFRKIDAYTSHFDLVSGELCAKVLAAPTKP